MLKGLDPLLNAELLHMLAAMGHGDEVAVVDANFPATTMGQRLVRMDGVGAPRTLEAILSLMPLDDFVDHPANVMQVVEDANAVPEAVKDFQEAIDQAEGRHWELGKIERFAFYERVRKCFGVVATGETRLYGNVIVTKGVVRTE